MRSAEPFTAASLGEASPSGTSRREGIGGLKSNQVRSSGTPWREETVGRHRFRLRTEEPGFLAPQDFRRFHPDWLQPARRRGAGRQGFAVEGRIREQRKQQQPVQDRGSQRIDAFLLGTHPTRCYGRKEPVLLSPGAPGILIANGCGRSKPLLATHEYRGEVLLPRRRDSPGVDDDRHQEEEADRIHEHHQARGPAGGVVQAVKRCSDDPATQPQSRPLVRPKQTEADEIAEVSAVRKVPAHPAQRSQDCELSALEHAPIYVSRLLRHADDRVGHVPVGGFRS